MVEFVCERCGMVRALPNDGRAWEIAVIHVHGLCLNTPIDSWKLSDYRVTFDDGLPQISLFGEPWIRVRRTDEPIRERLARRGPRRRVGRPRRKPADQPTIFSENLPRI